jgi:hypothetical protein
MGGWVAASASMDILEKKKMYGTYRDSNPGPSSPQPTDYATPPSPLTAFFLMCKEPLLNDVIIFLFPVGCWKHNCIFFSQYIRPSVQLSTRPSADPNIHPLSTPIPSVSTSSRSTHCHWLCLRWGCWRPEMKPATSLDTTNCARSDKETRTFKKDLRAFYWQKLSN